MPHRQLLTLLTSVPLLASLTVLAQADYAPRDYYGALYEPDSTVLMGVGQREELALALYAEAMPEGMFPSLFSTYIPTRADAERREESMSALRDLVRYYPDDLVITVGMSMTNNRRGYTEEILAGVYDDNIDATARALDSLGTPVIVRIGYESNGFWNGYQPASYRAAFAYVAARLRAVSPRLATAWSIHPIENINQSMTYYPGDEHVDWWDVSFFQESFITNQHTRDFMARAREHRRPVLIGESTPTWVSPNQVGTEASWDRWYSTFFDAIAAYPAVKAVTYINRDWTTVSGLSDWGNTLLNADTTVLRRFRERVSSPLYEHIDLGGERLTATVEADTVVQLSRSDTFSLANAEAPLFAVGSTDAGDTTAVVLRFDLDSLADEELRAVKLWVAAHTDVLYEFDLSVKAVSAEFDADTLTYANRPRGADTALARFEVRNFQRFRLYPIDVTDLARAAVARGESRLAFEFVPHQDTVLYYFQAPARAEAYPPRLQVVYDRAPVSSSAPAAPATLALTLAPNPAGDRVRVSTTAAAYDYRLLDVTGRVFRSGSHRAGLDEYVDLRGLPAGSYVVAIRERDSGARATRVLLVE